MSSRRKPKKLRQRVKRAWPGIRRAFQEQHQLTTSDMGMLIRTGTLAYEHGKGWLHVVDLPMPDLLKAARVIDRATSQKMRGARPTTMNVQITQQVSPLDLATIAEAIAKVGRG